jgi:5'-nucleotidase
MNPARIRNTLISLPLALALGACAVNAPGSSQVDRLTIFAINDFHGHIQTAAPVPYTYPEPAAGEPARTVAAPHGGLAHLATALRQLRAANPNSVTVGVGDLIGGSPLGSSLLKDEPTLDALSRLGLELSVLGNHELDAGRDELQRKLRGECDATGCAWPDFRGVRLPYIAANVIDEASGRPWLEPLRVVPVGNVKVGFIGAVTRDTPSIVMPSGISGLRFEDEARSINAQVPAARQQGAQLLVALVHEGGKLERAPAGEVERAGLDCPDLKGPVVDIVRQLATEIKIVFSAHTHQAYTCRIDGRLLVQGQSYGALITQVDVGLDARSGELVESHASNHKVSQAGYAAAADMTEFIASVEKLTRPIRTRPVATLQAPITRTGPAGSETHLGAVIADAQLAYARRIDPQVRIALMNPGGIRADLGARAAGPLQVDLGDLFAVQPFGNELVSMSLSGAEIAELLEQQWPGPQADPARLLQPSAGLSYRWSAERRPGERVRELRLDGSEIAPDASYRVVVNSFLAEGGDRYGVLKQGRERRLLGPDLQALADYLGGAEAAALMPPQPARIRQER